MKDKWYRGNGMKVIMVMLEIAAITAGLLSGVFIAALWGQGIRLFDKDSGTYVKSESFGYEVFDIGCTLLRNIERVRPLDQVSEEAVVCLDTFLEDGELSFDTSGTLKYRLGDLLKWNRQLYGDYVYNEKGEQVIVCQMADGSYDYFYLNEFKKKIRDGELKIVYDDSYNEITDEDVLQSLESDYFDYENYIKYITDKEGRMLYDSVWNYGSDSIKEQFAPVGAENLLEIVNDNPEWNGRLSEIYDILNGVMCYLADYRDSSGVLDSYAEGDTNLTYLYVDKKTREVFTNKNSYKAYSGSEKAIRQMTGGDDPFILVQPLLKDCDTNLSMSSDLQRWNHIIGGCSESDDYVYAVTVDKDFPLKDRLYYARESYEKYTPVILPVAAICLGSLVLFVIGLAYLTAVAGRRPGDEELHLCGFDKWFTEIAAGTVIAVWGMGAAFCVEILENLSVERLQFRVVAVSLALLTAVVCLMGYLSLVRRIKAKTLWKGSLIRWILGKAGHVWKTIRGFIDIYGLNTGGKIKNTLILACFMILQYCFTGVVAFDGSGLALLLLLVMDAAAIVYCLWRMDGRDRILKGLRKISEGDLQYKISLEKLKGDQREIAEKINSIGQGLDAAVENSLKNERMKTELITNVSHDIKTPLTSIINYVDLLKRENFTDPKICGYLDVLEQKAQRLKVLTEDVVEASKVSTGNISLEMVELNFSEMVQQAVGEFQERFRERKLNIVMTFDEVPMIIRADGRRLWRVLENVFNNTAKYAMEGTRVYVELHASGKMAVFAMKNISAQPLNISADELTERFIRGDVSRNTEGSGLGLSIAKSLTELQGGNFQLYLDGDLFKVLITFPVK